MCIIHQPITSIAVIKMSIRLCRTHGNTDSDRRVCVCTRCSESRSINSINVGLFDQWFILHTFSVLSSVLFIHWHISFSVHVFHYKREFCFAIDSSNWFLSSFEKFTCAQFFYTPLISFMTLIFLVFLFFFHRCWNYSKIFERHRKFIRIFTFVPILKSLSFFFSCGFHFDVNEYVNTPRILLLMMVFHVSFAFRSLPLSLTSFWHNCGNFTSTIRFYGHFMCFIVVHLFWFAFFFFLLIRRSGDHSICLVIFLMHFGHWYDYCLYWKINTRLHGGCDETYARSRAQNTEKHKGKRFSTLLLGEKVE